MGAAVAAASGAGAVMVYASTTKMRLAKAVLGGISAGLAALAMHLSRAMLGLPRELFPIEEWVAQYDEDAYEPDIAILDAHHHMWDPRTQDKGWPVSNLVIAALYKLKPRIMNDIVARGAVKHSFGERCPLACPYMGEEISADMGGLGEGRGHKVVGSVYVECGWHTPGVEPCMAPVAEADMVAGVHRQYPGICSAVVPHADLRLGAAVEPALKYYKQIPLVKGIRHALAWSDDPLLLGGPCEARTAYDAEFRKGFALLSKYGLSYDTWLFHEQVDGLTDLARSFPETTIICDHIAFPLGLGRHKIEESMPKWKESMRALAKEQNVVVKIGGLGMRFLGFGFDERPKPPTSDELAEAWGPFVRWVVETFGVDRCLMESNFPMDKVTCSYTVLFNALKKTLKDYSKEDKRKMFELNARRVYRL